MNHGRSHAHSFPSVGHRIVSLTGNYKNRYFLSLHSHIAVVGQFRRIHSLSSCMYSVDDSFDVEKILSVGQYDGIALTKQRYEEVITLCVYSPYPQCK